MERERGMNMVLTETYEVHCIAKGKTETSLGFYRTEDEARRRKDFLIHAFMERELPRYIKDNDSEISRQQTELLLRAIAELRYTIRKGEITWLPKVG